MTKNRIYLASVIVAMLSIGTFIGCQSVAPVQVPSTPIVSPATQPTSQPAVVTVVPAQPVVAPVVHAADVAAAMVTQNSGLITAILSLLGISAAGHITNIAKTVAGAYQVARAGNATVASVVEASTEVAGEVAAIAPKAAPAIQKAEQVVAAISTAVAPK